MNIALMLWQELGRWEESMAVVLGRWGAWEALEAWGIGRECGSRLLSPFSKKFLWEELELVREEVTFIYQKLREFLEAHSLEGMWGYSASPGH